MSERDKLAELATCALRLHEGAAHKAPEVDISACPAIQDYYLLVRMDSPWTVDFMDSKTEYQSHSVKLWTGSIL